MILSECLIKPNNNNNIPQTRVYYYMTYFLYSLVHVPLSTDHQSFRADVLKISVSKPKINMYTISVPSSMLMILMSDHSQYLFIKLRIRYGWVHADGLLLRDAWP